MDDGAYDRGDADTDHADETEKTMRSIPLRLESYYVDETRTKALPQYRAPEDLHLFDAVSCTPTVDEASGDAGPIPGSRRDRRDADGPGRWRRMRRFVRIVGFFRVTDAGAPMDAKRQMIHGAAVSMLYSAARDHLHTVTAKGPNEPLIPAAGQHSRSGRPDGSGVGNGRGDLRHAAVPPDRPPVRAQGDEWRPAAERSIAMAPCGR